MYNNCDMNKNELKILFECIVFVWHDSLHTHKMIYLGILHHIKQDNNKILSILFWSSI